jgi:hypothetical protein
MGGTEVVGTVKVLLEGFQGAADLVKWLEEKGFFERFRDWFRQRHKILILGSTGVGKTQLIKSLAENYPDDISRLNRSTRLEKLDMKINKDLFDFIAVPGEAVRASERREAILDASRGVAGILNVVAYRYHEHRAGTPDQAVTKTHEPRIRWLDMHRRLESDALGEWVSTLGNRAKSKKLITVVNKADLWWDSSNAVRSYYESGAYANRLGPARELEPEVAFYCSTVKRFWDHGVGSGSFTDKDRVTLRYSLLKRLFSLAR